ncbi:MAG: hypothetical protein JWM80_5666 [Cyanobacteria bacterium RYN_339]|nr:hypothetical protein [Cyanobacteria bacterium RYN_339]
MQRHLWTAAAAVMAFALAGCPSNNPAGGTKPTGTTTAAKTVALSGSVIAPAGIVAQGAGNIVAQGGGNLVPKGAGIVAQGGGNIVAQGAGNMKLLAAGGTTALAGTVVVLINASTLKEVTRTKTDAKGAYSFSKLASGGNYRVLAAGLKGADPVTLSTLAKAGGKPAEVNLATTCTMMACLIKAKNQMNDIDATKFASMVAGFDTAIKDVEPPDLSKPGNLPRWLGCHMTADLRAQMDGLVASMTKLTDAVAATSASANAAGNMTNLTDAINAATQAASQAAGEAAAAASLGAEAAKTATEVAAQAKELGDAMGIGDMAKAAAQLDGCD